MRISLFTGRDNDEKRMLAVESAAGIAMQHQSDLLVLPGYSLGRNNENPEFLQELSNGTKKIAILAEVDDTYCFRPSQSPLGPFIQKFGNGAEARCAGVVQEVTDKFLSGERILTIENMNIGILLCGENNVLTNIKKQNYKARPRHSDIPWPFDCYDILINPAHTSMGEFHLLYKRFAYFSKSNRTLLYCTNNIHKGWKTSLCVYKNGKKVVMCDFVGAGNFHVHCEPNWRLITVEI